MLGYRFLKVRKTRKQIILFLLLPEKERKCCAEIDKSKIRQVFSFNFGSLNFLKKHSKFEKIFLMVLTNQLIYLVNVKTMRKIFSTYVCFSKSPNFNGRSTTPNHIIVKWAMEFEILEKLSYLYLKIFFMILSWPNSVMVNSGSKYFANRHNDFYKSS